MSRIVPEAVLVFVSESVSYARSRREHHTISFSFSGARLFRRHIKFCNSMIYAIPVSSRIQFLKNVLSRRTWLGWAWPGPCMGLSQYNYPVTCSPWGAQENVPNISSMWSASTWVKQESVRQGQGGISVMGENRIFENGNIPPLWRKGPHCKNESYPDWNLLKRLLFLLLFAIVFRPSRVVSR